MIDQIYLIELFAGIGSQAKALKNIGLNIIHHKVIEFDKYAIASYNSIHNTNFKPTDITTIKGEDLEITNTQFYTYLMTYSFPCQDLSLAGKGAGMTKGNSTRSGLLWEVERLLNECKELPQYLLLENVPQIHSKKNIDDFKLWQKFLEEKGYNNYWQDLNAKKYGIPQNRNRTFMVSIRKDVDLGYDFPQPFELKLRLKDMLEDEVDEKYYLSDTLMRNIQSQLKNTETVLIDMSQARIEGKPREYVDISPTLTSRDYKEPRLIQVGNLSGGKWDKINESCRRVYDSNGIAPTIHTCQGGNTEPKICIKDKNLWTDTQKQMITDDGNVKRYLDSDIVDEFKEGQVADISFPNGYNKAKRVHDECPTINQTTTQSSFIIKITQTPLRIRKLTPKECWRLMGFSDIDFDRAEKVNSNAQLYKQAGNSIVVNVLEHIFKELFKERKEKKQRKERYEKMNIFDFIGEQ